jgi:hypothetical protein
VVMIVAEEATGEADVTETTEELHVVKVVVAETQIVARETRIRRSNQTFSGITPVQID